MLLSTVVGLAMAEIVLRVFGYSPTYVNALRAFHEADPASGHRGKRGFVGRFCTRQFTITVAHNEHGFRRQEYQNPDDSPHRLFVFGDSFTWGWGVEQGEVFTDRMSVAMPDWRIENYGINATGTVAQYELFAAECRDRLRAGDVVLVMFFQNDFHDSATGSRRAEVRGNDVVTLPAATHLRPSWKQTCEETSHLFNFLSFTWNRYYPLLLRHWREQQIDELATAANGGQLAVDESGHAAQAAIVRHYLSQWKRDCDASGAHLLVAHIPYHIDLDQVSQRERSVELAFEAAFRGCAESAGVETIELRPWLAASLNDSPAAVLSIPRDGHWTARGHAVVAEILARRLRRDATAAKKCSVTR
ncbi:MAG TPA: SGNH/GDSL hydrolase family protein [Pirellulales bacterium]|nr:SGNH/GDSL hydrolase family protein [Pirellulales bacterium]